MFPVSPRKANPNVPLIMNFSWAKLCVFSTNNTLLVVTAGVAVGLGVNVAVGVAVGVGVDVAMDHANVAIML